MHSIFHPDILIISHRNYVTLVLVYAFTCASTYSCIKNTCIPEYIYVYMNYIYCLIFVLF